MLGSFILTPRQERESTADTARTGRGGRTSALALAALVAAVAAVGAYGASVVGPYGGYDAPAFVRYAELVAAGELPRRADTYEYASPPAYPTLAAALHGVSGSWWPGQALSLGWTLGILVVTWLLARELWPRRPLLWAAAAAITAALPIVVRLATMFHPESQFAFFAVLALLLAVRGHRSGWRPWDGAALGAALGAAALTRPTAAVVIVAVGAAVVAAGRRDVLRFAAAAAGALLLLAGPWWAWQTYRYGNPLQSNLDRYILAEGQPLSFYVSAPVEDLVLHPFRPAFAGQLWPQFHADLWSDWFGGQHGYWNDEPGAFTRVFVSMQSVLGLLATPLLVGGLAVCGVRGVRGLASGARRTHEFAFATFALLAAFSWIAFVVQLVRFPQAGGDPIKARYMLSLGPVVALAGVAAGEAVWERGRAWRAALLALAAAGAVSYAGFLLTSW